VNKAQLIDELASRFEGNKKTATHALDSVIDAVTRSVAKGERVAITGFGIFEKVDRPARTGRNPRTGATVRIRKTSVPRFKAGQAFKDVVSGAKKLPKAAAATTAAAAGTATRAAKTATGTARKTATAATKAAPAKRAATKSAPAKTTAAKKAPATKTAAKTTAAKKTTATKTTATKTTATKTAAKKAPAKRAAKKA
jgi:DNA-binding protein HU-beta